jgi:hypothetical protein
VTGARLELAAPEPPTYDWKFVTSPAVAALDAGLDAAGALLAGAEVAGAELLLLELEQPAASPVARQAATAIARHLKPAGVHRRVPVKRTIAPFRLSAVNDFSASAHLAACQRAGRRN